MAPEDRKLSAAKLAGSKQTQRQVWKSNTKLYRYKTMKILLAIVASVCLSHLPHLCSSTSIQAETTTMSMTAASTNERPTSSVVAATTSVPTTRQQEHQSVATSLQQSITTTTTTAPTVADTNLDNRLTTITIFKIQKQALHSTSGSEGINPEGQSWLIDKSDPAPTSRAANELAHPSPQPLAAASSTTTTSSPPPVTVTFASSSRTPSVLRPSIEEVASKLSRKHLNLEHDNWRLRQAAQSSFDDTTKLASGSESSPPIDAEQDVQMVSAPSNESSQPHPEREGVFSSPSSSSSSSSPPKLSEGHHHEHYLHIDTASSTVEQPKSRQTSRRKKGGFFTGEAYEISQCHQYLKIYNAPSSGTKNPSGLYQMTSNNQLPCSCEMRSQIFSLDSTAPIVDQQSPMTSWLSCDNVQLVGGYLHPHGSNSSGDTWDMGKVSATANDTGQGDTGPIQVTRFSQRNSGLQTLHAQKFLNLQLFKLKSIDLSDNRIRQIKVDAFHGLELSLENLNLANNLLGDSRAISYSAQNSNPQQQSKSKLIFFTDEFKRLKKLKWLSLKNNQINQLGSGIFTKSPTTSASFIQQHDPTATKPMIKIKNGDSDDNPTGGEMVYLDLSDNILKTVPSDSIVALNSLQTLNLRGNKIVQLDEQSKFPISLKYLDLSENLIKIIRNCDLIDLPDLIELNLSHNQLSQLDNTAFLSSAAIANNNLQLTNVDATAGESSESSPSSSSSLTSSNNLIITNAVPLEGSQGSQLLASGNNDEHTRLLASVREETKSSLYLDQPMESLSLPGVRELTGQPKTRSRRDVINRDNISHDLDADGSRSAIISEEDDLDAEESGLTSSLAALGQQINTGQRTLADDPVRRQREFNSTIKLNLAYNYFTSLPGDSLLKFPNLQQLDLSYNRIRHLDSNYLCSVYNLVENLRELDLSGNLLTLPQTSNLTAATSSSSPAASAAPPATTTEGASTTPSRQLNRLFGCLQKLERLSLGTNRLSSPESQSSQRLRGKNLANDDIVSEEDEFGGARTRSATTSDPPDRLHIKFGDNYGSRYLNQLDLSDNQLRTMPLIEQVFRQPMTLTPKKSNSSSVLSADDQQQHQLNQWMASRVYLVSLNLSYNYIDRLDERDFDHLFSLRQLSLEFNRLSSLPTKLMRKFTSLDRVSFNGNRLSSLGPLNELFERSIRTLRCLDLANNRLTMWPAINKVLYENPLRQDFVPSLQIDSEDKQALALQFSLEELNLEGNLFTSSNVSTLFDQFAYMKSLRILNLSQNLLNRVRSEWFKFANHNLRILSLAGNKINSIDLGSFAYNQLNELQQLKLNRNLLRELKRKTFDSLPKLKRLDLSHNFIHTINSETFHQMNAMQVLNLSNNKLTSWKCEYFSNLCNSITGNINADLTTLLNVVQPPVLSDSIGDRQPVSYLIDLDLSHNSLSQLRVNSISVHTKLEQLNLAHNKLSYIPHDLFKATILDSKTGRQIQLVSSLKRLNLAHNRIQTVDNINLRPVRNLIHFDLSHNELQTLGLDIILINDGNNNDANQHDRSIVVNNNTTNQLIDGNSAAGSDGGTLLAQQAANQLRQPRMMQPQQQQQQHGLPALGKLRHLNLSHNQLTQVNQTLLHELSPFVLLNLDLSHNYLESESLPYGFYVKIFGPTKQQSDSKSNNYDLVFTLKLESINLSHNRLSEFPTNLLENHHISMESCNLAHNRIQTLVANSNILVQIKSLNLEFNPLNRESNELILFEHKSARHLNLAATRLYAIKEVTQLVAQADKSSGQYHQLAHKHRLVANQTSQLDLIRSISKQIDAPYVQHLNLSSNQLVWLAANIFERMHSLQTLDLSNNQLTRLHLLTNQLSPLANSLESLTLASNLFTSVDSTDFSQLTRLRHLDLSSLLSLQKLNCRFLSKLTTLRSLRLFNFPQVRQNLNNILANLQHQNQQDSHASERMVRKFKQELLISTIGRHCFRDEPLLGEPNQQHQDSLRWFNLQDLELELFNTFEEDNKAVLVSNDSGKGGFQLRDELAQLLGPETKKLTLFGLNLTDLADDSLLGITGPQLDLKISYTSLARLPVEQVLNGISKRTRINLDFRNNNIQSLDVKSLQILDELQLNNQILQKGDHSSFRLASNPIRCDCQTRPLWLWLNQRWANFEQPPNQPEEAQGDSQQPVGSNSANYWLKFSSLAQTSDIKCQYPVKLRGKLAQHVNYHDLVCKGSSASSPISSGFSVNSNQPAGRQSRKRNETKSGAELSYYSKDAYNSAEFEDDTNGGEAFADADWDSDANTDAAASVRVTKFNRFPSLMYNQTVYYLQNIPVPFILDNQQEQRDQQPVRSEGDLSFELDSLSGTVSRMGKRDDKSANLPIYSILNDRQIVNTKYNKHRPNTQQRHSSFDTLSTLKQFQPAHQHHSGQKQALLTDLDVYILTIMSIAMSIMSFVIITICLLKYKMDRSDKERILTDHGKMLMSQALFNINNGNPFSHQSPLETKHPASGGSKSSSSKKSSNSSGSSKSSAKTNPSRGKSNDDPAATKRINNLHTTIPMMVSQRKPENNDQVLVLRDAAPSSMAMPAAAQNFLMRSPTVRRMQGLATNASDWFKYTLRAYPSNAAMHRGHRRRRLFLGDTVPVASQLNTGKRAIEERLAAEEPGSPATLAVGCPHHAFRAIDKLRDRQGTDHPKGVIEEKCLHCARLLATIQQTKMQYLVGGTSKDASACKQIASTKPPQSGLKEDGECFVPPSLIRALAEQLDQANAESNYVALGPEWLQQQRQRSKRETSAYCQRDQRITRPMKTFGVMDDRGNDGDDDCQNQQLRKTSTNPADASKQPKEGSQIPSVDVIGRFAYQSDSQVDTPTPYDARCSSMLGSSQLDGSEDTNGPYNRDGVFILVPDDSSDGDDKEPVSVLLNQKKKKMTTTETEETLVTDHHGHNRPEVGRSELTDAESALTDHQEESIRMQDECSRSSSPIAYGFMRNSGPSSLASSGVARNGPQPEQNRYQSDHHLQHRYAHSSSTARTTTTTNRGHYSPTSSYGNNNNNNISIDNYSVVRKKIRDEHHISSSSSSGQNDQQVIISRL